MSTNSGAVHFFLLPVVPVHLNDLEDEANDGDDQQTQLNGVRVCYRCPLALSRFCNAPQGRLQSRLSARGIMVTYSDLIQIGILIVGLLSLIVQITKK